MAFAIQAGAELVGRLAHVLANQVAALPFLARQTSLVLVLAGVCGGSSRPRRAVGGWGLHRLMH